MATQNTLQILPIGAHAPEFDLPATDGHTYSLQSFADKPYLVVVFLANHCPYVGAWEDRLLAIACHFAEHHVAFVGISSNDGSKIPEDSFEAMGKRVQEKGYPFPYLHDRDQSVARSFGATRTPEVFLFDQERLLRYHGAIDSDWEESSGMQNYLRDALHTLIMTAAPIMLPETPPVGCTIKYNE